MVKSEKSADIQADDVTYAFGKYAKDDFGQFHVLTNIVQELINDIIESGASDSIEMTNIMEGEDNLATLKMLDVVVDGTPILTLSYDSKNAKCEGYNVVKGDDGSYMAGKNSFDFTLNDAATVVIKELWAVLPMHVRQLYAEKSNCSQPTPEKTPLPPT